jgi:HNH endonuclease
MHSVKIRCFHCNKEFERSTRQYNEAKRKNWNQFCSLKCIRFNRLTGSFVSCGNPSCKNVFYKIRNQISQISNNYCSKSCSTTVHNLERGIKNQKKCGWSKCNQVIFSYKKYCSNKCFQATRKIPIKDNKCKVILGIKKFVKKYNRIPFKCELNYLYRPARIVFGSWNKAIKTAGFIPNKVMFTKKFIAKDSHVCDSLAEKVIDDWLFKKNIKHQINVPYPGNRFTVDFKVNNYWIEFFGLSGQHKKYDQLKKEKLQLIKKEKLLLIAIYPQDLFPKSKLNQLLNCLFENQNNSAKLKLL